MEESNIDRFLRESSKSYKTCKVKNYARRSSLQKKTLGIENERKLAQIELSREEKHLREHLKQMQLDKMKHSILHTLREHEHKKKSLDDSTDDSEEEIIRPHTARDSYRLTPLLYSPRVSPKSGRKKISLDERGRYYASQRGRRQSKEFEDLEIDTKTGKLAQPFNVAKRLISQRGKQTSLTYSPRTSPETGRRGIPGSPRMHSKHSETSDGSSSSPISSLEDLHWIGDPEATKSVRRSKKSHDDQVLSSELHKLKKK